MGRVEWLDEVDQRTVAAGFLVAGLLLGAAVGAGGALHLEQLSRGVLSDPGITVTFPSVDGVTPSEPGSSLRILQAIGLLLPLFVALLRVVVDPASEFDITLVNGLLLLGIVGLVLAGALAVVAGVFSDMAFVLKLSLLCLLAVFAVIAYAAAQLLSSDSASPDLVEAGPARDADDHTPEPTSAVRESEPEPDPEADDRADEPGSAGETAAAESRRSDHEAETETETDDGEDDDHTRDGDQQL